MDFITSLKSVKRYIYLEVALGIIAVSYMANLIIERNRYSVIAFIIGLVFAGIDYLCILRMRRKMTEYEQANFDYSPEFEKYFDRYGRRAVNWILIAFWEVFTFLLSMITLAVNSKVSEILDAYRFNLLSFEIATFFLLKNILLMRWLNKVFSYKKRDQFRAFIKKVTIGSAIYWCVAVGLFFVFEKYLVLDTSPFWSAIYFFAFVIINVFFINCFTYSHFKYRKVVISLIAAVCLIAGGYVYLSRDIWLTQPYINSIPNIYDGESKITYDDESGIYTITKTDGDFKILQITDVHLGGSVLSYDKDKMALETVYALLEETRPDFVIVTGDLVFPVGYASFSFNNTAPVQQFAAFMRNTGIPWAFTYGNHDTENYAATPQSGLNELYKSLSWRTSKTLMYPYVQPDIMGRNNQVIELRNNDGSLNQLLFLIDSNAYTGEGLNKYDYIHDDQVEWYREQVLEAKQEEGRIVPSMVFFHIPLQQYRTAYNLYEQGSDEVKYFFGSNDEKMIDKICCSEYPSKMFDVAKELGSTTGFFCGHDHYNNMSLEYEGIRLTYGMSIDYLAMPGIARDTAQRGATLITISDDGSSSIEQVPYIKK
jgi:hypothetical protein